MNEAGPGSREADEAGPGWLADWCAGPIDATRALALFDGLAPVEPEEMPGCWRGAELATGHPLDGALERLGWYGKGFESPDCAHPLLFRDGSGGIVSIDASLLPVGIAWRWPGLVHRGPTRAAFSALRPLLRTRRPTARLRRSDFRGTASASMLYDRQPIVDHFRRIGHDRLLGLMDTRGALPPYFFLLVRAGPFTPPDRRPLLAG